MRLLLTSLLALLAAIAVGLFLSRDAGRMLLTFGDWTVQMSAGVFVLAVIAAGALVYLLLRWGTALLHIPESLQRRAQLQRLQRSEQFLSRGLEAMVEGDWHAAERAFSKGARYSRIPLVNYLCAARAAQQQQAGSRRERYLELARTHGKGDGFALDLARAELQLGRRQTPLAHKTLQHLIAQRPGSQQVQRMLLQTAVELGDWEQALEVLGSLEKRRQLPGEWIRARQLEFHTGLLKQAARTGAREGLEQQWQRIPRRLRRDFHLLEVYVAARVQLGDSQDCEPVLRKAIQGRWDAGLVALYGRVQGKDAAKQLRIAEGWLEKHAEDPALRLTLGRLCHRNGLWGKARSYLEECIRLQPQADAFRELAELLEQRGDHAAAMACYRRGLAAIEWKVESEK